MASSKPTITGPEQVTPTESNIKALEEIHTYFTTLLDHRYYDRNQVASLNLPVTTDQIQLRNWLEGQYSKFIRQMYRRDDETEIRIELAETIMLICTEVLDELSEGGGTGIGSPQLKKKFEEVHEKAAYIAGVGVDPRNKKKPADIRWCLESDFSFQRVSLGPRVN